MLSPSGSRRQDSDFDDGACTELHNRGIFINRCFEEANLVQKDTVIEVHQEYLRKVVKC